MGNILELAEMWGWEDTFGDAIQGNWTPQEADACEESALDHLREQQVFVYNDEGVCLNELGTSSGSPCHASRAQ